MSREPQARSIWGGGWRLGSGAVLALTLSLAAALGGEGLEAKRAHVLVLNSYHLGYTWSDDVMAGVLDVFRAVDATWQPFVEYLDAKRLPGQEHFPDLAEYFGKKYPPGSVELVIAADNPALDFVAQYRATLFPSAPVVFCGINGFRNEMIAGLAHITGMAETLDPLGTLDIALRLHPETTEVVVLHDYTSTGLGSRHELEVGMETFRRHVKFRFIPNEPLADILKELAELPSDRLLLLLSFATAQSGEVLDHPTAAELFAAQTAVPIYAVHEGRLGHGIVGGRLLCGRTHGEYAAKTALAILRGLDPDRIPIERKSRSRPMFDCRQLARFDIPLSALPAGSVLINQPPSLYQQHRALVLATIAALIGLGLVIAVLATNIITRRKAEAEIRRLNVELEQRVIERTAQLEAAKEELEGEVEERKRTEEAWREQSHFLQVFLDALPSPIFFKDPEGKYVGCNKAFEDQVGSPREQILGKTVRDFFPAQADAHLAADEELFRTGGVQRYETQVSTPDGANRELLYHEALFHRPDGSPGGVVGAILDITERKRAEEALRLSHDLLNQSNDAIFVIERATLRFVSCNQVACDRLGYTREELLRMTVSDVDDAYRQETPPEALGRFRELGSATLAGHHKRKDGSSFPVEINAKLVRQGEAEYIVAVARDVTERLRAEEEIRRLNDALIQHAAELETANRDLEAFSYSVSHDLRAPLRAIDGFGKALAEDHAGQLDAEGHHFLQRILAGAQQMGALIDDLLKLARVARAEVRREKVNLSEVALEVAEELRKDAPQRHVDWIIAPALSAHADATLVRAVLENLLSNALKFTSKQAEARIELGGLTDREPVVFFVRDNGVGFDAAYADRLFQPFQRLHSQADFPGTGVGLATVQQIVSRHGGRAWAEGQCGAGAAFYFTLERSRREVRAREA